jgi:hypothetical protein
VDLDACVRQMTRSTASIETLVRGMTPEEARWKPRPGKWSALEIVCHLLDEEREDFRRRIDLLLNHPGEPWPGIDPEGWVTERGYANRDLAESLDGFLAERRKSIEWLRGLGSPDWERAHEHPKLGRIDAGSLLLSWTVHDLLHVRQLARLRYDHLVAVGDPHEAGYAGSPPSS